jgi:hypothetical protein
MSFKTSFNSTLTAASKTASTLAWLYKQLFSSSPDPSVASGVKMLNFMSKGFLIVGALSSMSYTIPTFYELWAGVFPIVVAQALTVFCVLLVLFLIELAYGALAPFALDFSISGKIQQNTLSAIAGIGLWAMVLFMGFLSMYFTYNGASTPVMAAIKPPEIKSTKSLEKEKQAAITAEENRYRNMVASAESKDKEGLNSLKASLHSTILNVEAYATKKYGKESYAVTEALMKARKDSAQRVEDFSTQSAGAAKMIRERDLAINDARAAYNQLIAETKTENENLQKAHAAKVGAAMMVMQMFGSGATALFLLLQIVVSMLTHGAVSGGSAKKFQGHLP